MRGVPCGTDSSCKMTKFITCDLDLLTSELDLHFLREQEQCLKNCTLSLNLLSDIRRRLVFICGTFKDKFPFSTQSLLESPIF